MSRKDNLLTDLKKEQFSSTGYVQDFSKYSLGLTAMKVPVNMENGGRMDGTDSLSRQAD